MEDYDVMDDFRRRERDHTSRVVARVRRALARTPRIREPGTPEICEAVDCSLLDWKTGILDVRECKDADRSVSGYPTTWGLPADEYGDILDRGSTRGTQKRWEASAKSMPLLDTHNTDSVRSIVGYAVKFREDAVGLWTRFKILPGTAGDEVLERVKAGLVDSFSIGYTLLDTRPPTKEEREQGVRRVITDLDLREVSVVAYPANRRALMDTMKGAMAKHPLWGVDPSTLTLPDRIDLIRRRALTMQIEGLLYKGRGVG